MKKRKINKYAAYSPNWKTQVVPGIRKRANEKCEKCGVQNHAIGYRNRWGGFEDLTQYAHRNSKKKWVVYRNKVVTPLWDILPNGRTLIMIILTIAHLDHDPENWTVSEDRLKALCQRCHLNNDRSHNIRKRRYGAYHKQPKLF